jgi:hypothetical protein
MVVLQSIVGADERDGEAMNCSKRVEGLMGVGFGGGWWIGTMKGD